MFLRAEEMGVKKATGQCEVNKHEKQQWDLPERTTAESKERGCEGNRRNERVMGVCGRGKGEQGGGIRVNGGSSEVLCFWHRGRLGEAGQDAQHGSVLSQETLVHPPQGPDLG